MSKRVKSTSEEDKKLNKKIKLNQSSNKDFDVIKKRNTNKIKKNTIDITKKGTTNETKKGTTNETKKGTTNKTRRKSTTDITKKGTINETKKDTNETKKTEKEKMISGELYSCIDKELHIDRTECRKILKLINNSEADEYEKRIEYCKKLFKNFGENSYIEPPFHCDYGYNINIGKRWYILK